LKGAKPDELPAARTLGLTIPQSILLRAETVGQ
jgi:hypothetical protein